MNGCRLSVDKAQTVQADERRAFGIGQALAPCDRAEIQQPMRRPPSLRLDSFGEARQIGRSALQRRKGDETPQALTPADQPLIDQNLDRAGYGEPADPKPFGKLRLALDPIADGPSDDVRPQPVHQLTVERTSGSQIRGEAVRARQG